MKPRRYLFAIVDGGGNVPPELGAARRLVDRGHSVTVLAEDSIAPDVRATALHGAAGFTHQIDPTADRSTISLVTGNANTHGNSSIG